MAYSLEIEGLVALKHKLEAELRAKMTEQEAFKHGFRAGLLMAADWLDKEAERWVQDRFKDRIMQLSHDIKEISAKHDKPRHITNKQERGI